MCNVMLEMTRNWQPNSVKYRVGNDVGHHILWQMRRALALPKPRTVDPETMAPLEYLPFLGFLIPNGQFDSNPCRAACILNPVYDIMPRQRWTVQSAMCTSPSDFVHDKASGTLCCPTADYCCPNSLTKCSHANATLFDASGVSDETLGRAGWLRHFASRFSKLARDVCGADGWGSPTCHYDALTVTSSSLARIQALWRAQPWMGIPPEDDDNCRMSTVGHCEGKSHNHQRDVLGF